MKKYTAHALITGLAAAAAFAAVSPAAAQTVGCGYYRPGLLEVLLPVRPALCPYQGPYIVQQGPVYDGPAIIAPQPTYADSRTLNYVYGPPPGEPVVAAPPVERVVAAPPVRHTVKRTVRKKRVATKGKPQVVRANAEVRIYSPSRMDIRLYRR